MPKRANRYCGVYAEDKKKFLQKIGQAAAKWRAENGFTQLDISMRTGYSIPNISSFEHGMSNSAFLLYHYAQLGFSFDDFVRGEILWQNTH